MIPIRARTYSNDLFVPKYRHWRCTTGTTERGFQTRRKHKYFVREVDRYIDWVIRGN